MDTLKIPNKLIHEKSPYLLQHAYNPVNWHPWDDEAFEKAKREDKPVFLSIGYSTCHWCHVMERESFEHQDVADILNSDFVCIKLDREERPDIDHIYMEVCMAMTGRGGWPLSVFTDADKRPFFAGTYFPKDSFKVLLAQISSLYKRERSKLGDIYRQVEHALNQAQGYSRDIADDEVVQTAFFYLKNIFDYKNGGFGTAPKFPTGHLLLFLLALYEQNAEKSALEMAETTLLNMRRGGIFDHIGFGFSRYSTDNKWLVPHFEKMLYDNSLLSYVYTKAFAVTKNEAYADTACAVLDYIRRKLMSNDGGFYSAEDADSEGEEGKFYVWTPDEIKAILGEDAQEFCTLFDITPQGNFNGTSIPNLIGKQIPPERTKWADSCIDRVFKQREKRVHPFLDDKILVSWNGLAIAAFASAGKILKRSDYTGCAAAASEFIDNTLGRDDGRLMSRYRDNEVKYNAHAEDYAFYTWGLLELHAATRDTKYLKRALQLTDIFLQDFWDEENGGFYFCSKSSKELIANPKPVYDGAMPSANSVSALNLLRLAVLTGENKFGEYADRIFSAFSADVANSPGSYGFLMYALIYKNTIAAKVVISANKQSDAGQMLSVIPENAEVVVFTPDNTMEQYAKNYKMINNLPTAYVCKGHTCSPPVTNAKELAALLT